MSEWKDKSSWLFDADHVEVKFIFNNLCRIIRWIVSRLNQCDKGYEEKSNNPIDISKKKGASVVVVTWGITNQYWSSIFVDFVINRKRYFFEENRFSTWKNLLFSSLCTLNKTIDSMEKTTHAFVRLLIAMWITFQCIQTSHSLINATGIRR